MALRSVACEDLPAEVQESVREAHAQVVSKVNIPSQDLRASACTYHGSSTTEEEADNSACASVNLSRKSRFARGRKIARFVR